MTTLDVIRNWALERPRWQQAALQMLYENPQLTDVQLRVLVAVCRADAGVPGETLAPPSLELGGAVANSPTSATTVLGVRDVHNVNALLPNQDLTFANSGITLVFGDNGVGKSGYVRILKQACRARGARATVHPNAYSDDQTPLSAIISFNADGSGPFEHQWTPGSGSPSELRQVSILDSHSALVYVDGAQDIAYLPFGLDLFQRLSQVCDRVSSQLQLELAQERASRDRFADFSPATPVGEALQRLDTPKYVEKLLTLRGLSDDEMILLQDLGAEESALRVGDPGKRATELELRIKRVRNVAARLETLASKVADTTAGAILQAHANSRAADEAAAAAADTTFAHFPLQGVSSEAWMHLWQAAREFATTAAAPPQEFPPAAGALCVLCQQPVGASAAARLAAFNGFVLEQLASNARDARASLANKVEALERVSVEAAFSPEDVGELNALSAGLGDSLQDHWTTLCLRAQSLAKGIEPVPGLPKGMQASKDTYTKVLLELESQVSSLRSSDTAERLAGLQQRIAALEARAAVDRVWDRVEAEIARQKRIVILVDAERTTSTTGVTLKGKQLLAEAVTEPLAAQLRENLRELGLAHIPIEFAPAKGAKGTVVHQVKLNTTVTVANSEILSEGEFRAVAIAGFLAEVQVQESASTLIFDDPVSSLDLGRREFVAQALVALAAKRPVVIFTHDMPFAWQIVEAAGAQGTPLSERQIWRAGESTGFVSDMMAASGLPASKRLGPLKQRAVVLKKLFTVDPPGYEREAHQIYSELRQAWERGVEEALLNGAIRRFGNEVKTRSLNKLHLITGEHIARLEKGMTKASTFMHDQAQAFGKPAVPPPEEVVADVEECEQWVRELKKLHN